jgi:hypothetical protein
MMRTDEYEQQILSAMYKAFNARQIEAVLAQLHPDVDWPNGMEGGRVLGRTAVRAYWSRQWTLINPRVDPLNLSQDDQGRTVVDVHQVVRDLKGQLLADQRVQHTYTFRDGLITRMDIN